MIRACLCLCVALSLAIPTPSLAADTPAEADEVSASKREARALFREGAALAQQNRWDDALRAFEQSARLLPHARTTYNIGYCERSLGRSTRARKAFRAALATDEAGGGTQLSENQRSSARAYVEQAEKRLARLDVTLSPDGAGLAVDGRPLEVEKLDDDGAVLVAGTRELGTGEAAPRPAFQLLIEPGPHVMELSVGSRRHTLTVRLRPGETRALRLEMPPGETPEPRAIASAPEPDRTPRASKRVGDGQLAGAVVLGGAGLALAAIGTGLAIESKRTFDAAEAACPGGTNCPDDEAFDQSHDARRLGNLATVTLFTSASAGAGAALLWLTAKSADHSAVGRHPWGIGPGAVEFRARF